MQDIVDWGLCTGCGTCVAACNREAVTLVNIESVGIRPQFTSDICSGCNECIQICPGYIVDGDLVTKDLQKKNQGDVEFGPTLEIWEGHAVDSEIRYKGSSGGVISAISQYCLDNENMEFVLHSGMDKDRPYLNKTYKSRSRNDLLERAGSRYSPASPCEGLKKIEESKSPCVFIGKPCDVAGATLLRTINDQLNGNLGLVLSFFCAGLPSTQGTLDLIKSFNISKDDIEELRYRGEGWPGFFKFYHGREKNEKTLTYKESWSKLNKYCSFRCRICPDGLGRNADLSCGDAWHIKSQDIDLGRSIVLVRTLRGKEILHRAMEANYIDLKQISYTQVLDAQENLLGKRKELLGRLFAMKLLLVPVPKYTGFSLFQSWMKLPFVHKMRSVLGTLRRLIQRGLWHKN